MVQSKSTKSLVLCLVQCCNIGLINAKFQR